MLNVVALILKIENLLFMTKRPLNKGGEWEFPGGKVEVGETLQLALQREIQEELSIDYKMHATDKSLGSIQINSLNKQIKLHFFFDAKFDKAILSKIVLTEHTEWKLFDYEEILNNKNISVGDKEFVKLNKSRLFGSEG